MIQFVKSVMSIKKTCSQDVIYKLNSPFPWCLLVKLIVLFLCLTINSTVLAENKTNISLDSVTLKLKWKTQFQFAGYYAALEKGFYRQAGLDVKIIEAMEGEESIESVLNGDAEFGTAMSDLALFRAKGHPVVALASIFQHSPLSIVVPKNTGIQNIHDLKGKRIALEPHSEELIAYMKSEGIPLSKMTVIPHAYDTSQLIKGDVDAISAYSTDETFTLSKKGLEYKIFSARSGGIDFYGDTLFTTEQQVHEHPERVSAFLKASLAGWEYALNHSEEIIDFILSKHSRRHSREHLVFEALKSKRLIMADVIEIGYMNPGRWKHIADIYVQLGMANKDYSLEGFIYDPNPKTDFKRLYTTMVILISITVLVFLIAVYFYELNRSLKKEIQERRRVEKELEKYRIHLEELVNKRTEDLTQANIQLKISKEEAEKADRAKSNFLANMSHELRTPMNGILGNLYLLQQSNLDGTQSEYTTESHESAKKLHRLIETLLDYSKLDRDSLIIESERFSLSDALASVFEEAEANSQQKGLSFIATKKNLPLELEGNGKNLITIIRHLLDNAVKYTERGEITVQLEGKDLNDKSIRIHCTVVDSGIGMDQDLFDTLSRSFTQGDASSTRNYGGLGLGLTLCRKLVEQMAGKLSVKSEKGVGSIFSFTVQVGKVTNSIAGNDIPSTAKDGEQKQEGTAEAALAKFDFVDLTSQLKELDQLVKQRDTEAITLFSEIKSALLSVDRENAKEVMKKLDVFDFKGARQGVLTILKLVENQCQND